MDIEFINHMLRHNSILELNRTNHKKWSQQIPKRRQKQILSWMNILLKY